MSTTATANQFGFIASLIRERARTLKIDNVDAAVEALREQRLTMEGASTIIDNLVKLPKDAPVATPGDTRGNLPKNRYGGRCVLCGGNVGEGEGTYRRGDRGWETLHLPGQCGEPLGASNGTKQSFGELVTEILDGIPDGWYAVAGLGDNDLTFVRFATNKGFHDPSKKGQRYVRHIVGGHGEMQNVGIDWIRKVAAAVNAAGVDESAILYGQHIGSCGFCNTELTRRYSRDMGYGPTCADKHSLPFDYAAYAASQVISDGKGE
jgi:Family of unknown function (DUF6011)